jgi:hypothetical protein
MLVINATFLSRFLLMRRLVFPWYGEMSSDVMSSIMAVTASHGLMPPRDSGKYMSVLPHVPFDKYPHTSQL